MPVFDKQLAVTSEEAAIERARKRQEARDQKKKRKDEIKKKQEAKEKAKEARAKMLAEEAAAEQAAIDAQKEAQEQALAAIKAAEDAKKKAAEAKNKKKDDKKKDVKKKDDKKKDDKKKDDKKKDDKKKKARRLSPSGTKVEVSRDLAKAEEKAAAAATKEVERKIEYEDPEKFDFQKPLCTLFPTKKSECYRDDHQKCMSCRKGYVPDGLKCKKCVDKCLTCDRPNKCTLCNDGYVLKKLGPRDTVCVKCDDLKDIYDGHNNRCVPFKDMDYKEKLKSFQDTQFKRFTFPEIQVPNKKDLFMYVQFWFEWQISPYKIMVDIESMDDGGQKVPTKKY